MKQLRADFERLRILLELVKKREQIKMELINVNTKILEHKANNLEHFNVLCPSFPCVG